MCLLLYLTSAIELYAEFQLTGPDKAAKDYFCHRVNINNVYVARWLCLVLINIISI